MISPGRSKWQPSGKRNYKNLARRVLQTRSTAADILVHFPEMTTDAITDAAVKREVNLAATVSYLELVVLINEDYTREEELLIRCYQEERARLGSPGGDCVSGSMQSRQWSTQD
jgi:hypothetical protein